jgi:hypothetical protein
VNVGARQAAKGKTLFTQTSAHFSLAARFSLRGDAAGSARENARYNESQRGFEAVAEGSGNKISSRDFSECWIELSLPCL